MPSSQSPSIPSTHRLSAALVTCFVLVLALPWALWAPPFEKPDEIHHVGYVLHIVRRAQLPDPRLELEAFARMEAHQPPLYYLIGAATLGLAEKAGLPALELDSWVFRHNERFRGGRRPPDGAKRDISFFEHAGVGWFDDPDYPAGLLILRLLSTAIAGAAAWHTTRLMCELFAGRPHVALATSLIATALPTRIMLSSAVNNDVLAWLLGAMILRKSLDIARSDRHADVGSHVALGLLMGLGLLTKLTLLTALPLVLAAIGRGSPRRWLGATIAWAAALCLTAGPWFLRNALRYGDLLGRQERIDPGCCTAWMRDVTAWQVISSPVFWRNTWETGLASYGFVNVWLHPLFYRAALVLPLLSVVGWGAWLVMIVIRAWRGFRAGGHSQADGPAAIVSMSALRAGALCLVFALGSLAALVAYNTHFNQQQGRYLYHALPAWAVMVSTGWLCLWQLLWRPVYRLAHRPVTWVVLLAGLGAAINGWGLFAVSLPAYRAEVRQEEDLAPTVLREDRSMRSEGRAPGARLTPQPRRP